MMLLSAVLQKFVREMKLGNFSDETILWYAKRLDRLTLYLNDKAIERVTLNDLQNFVAYLQSKEMRYTSSKYHRVRPGGLSPHTIHGYVRSIKRFFAWANKMPTAEENVALGLKLPKISRDVPKEIPSDDLKKILKASRRYGNFPKRNYAMLRFLAVTGVRVAGLCRLRAQDFNMRRRYALVTEKGKKTRAVFFDKETARALRSWFAECQETDTVFGLTPQGVRMVLRHLKKFAGISGAVNPHAFRHAFAKRSINRGLDVSLLSVMMGHSDISTTRNAYLIFKTSELARAHRKYCGLPGGKV